VLRRLPAAFVAIATVASLAQAQGPAVPEGATPNRLERTRSAPERASGLSQPAPRSSLALEALGGSLGSAVGIGAVLLLSECGPDDMACDFISVGVAGAAGVLGATLGTTLVARRTGAKHSVAGAALGAILGTAVGLGVHYLLNNNSDRNLDDLIVLPIFAISQGLFAAILGRR
jgi:hypothetical protein